MQAAGGEEFDCTACTNAGRNRALGCSGLPRRSAVPIDGPAFPSGWRSPQFGMMHLGFFERPDLTHEPIQTCPARSIDNLTVEWTLLFGDSEYGAEISREAWCPAWRDIHRSLRVEKRLIDQSVRKSKEG